MEALARFAVEDEYVVSEMILLYKAANALKRIELLAEWHQSPIRLPFEVAKLAVEDQDESVRYWMARHARDLDYREGPRSDEPDDKHTELNLEARLRADPVPIIRAAVLENPRLVHPHDHFHDRAAHLAAMSQLERLAYMRNPALSWVGHAQIIADMPIPMHERQQLILVLLTNRAFVDGSHRWTWEDDFAKLWDTLSRWPPSHAQSEFFRRIYAPDSTKEDVYKACQKSYVRIAILEGCDASGRDEEVLKLETNDADLDVGNLRTRSFRLHLLPRNRKKLSRVPTRRQSGVVF
jgi:hypothetical protein